MDKVSIRTIKIYGKDEKEFITDWLEGLEDIKARIKILRKLDRVKFKKCKDLKDLGNGLFELKINYGEGYYIYYTNLENDTILLLYGGELSRKESIIEQAKEYMAEHTKRKGYSYYREYDELLLERLMLEKEAQQHLETALEEFIEDRDKAIFLRALREVAVVHGGIAELSEKTKLNRQSLHKALCPTANPKLDIIGAIIKGLGFKIRIEADT
ncbi:addiction module killer protein [endosymbiont of Acanthamoeba sp. UWC8]|uniref:type II toxin-antitoxin system RelE/ParE family toxin n=1 Tax=endosymbiont of Acanthamoeba sp. UWC8 TaxID=86106 RepID=UPI0004D117E3|nr:type II toxin-antitoxin system RelE/ParE family toxin [endosymbiont of Acanthamoeba sp. UWC8]AIF81741.1 addiction module killer protein [endosymbiont of Acanthamoeba sp. UWC8]